MGQEPRHHTKSVDRLAKRIGGKFHHGSARTRVKGNLPDDDAVILGNPRCKRVVAEHESSVVGVRKVERIAVLLVHQLGDLEKLRLVGRATFTHQH